MLVIRRLETRRQGFTVLMLGPDYVRQFPTTLQEHQRILEIFKQDRRYRDVVNDFTEYDLDAGTAPAD